MIENIGFASLGNGISVYDRSRIEHGDYKKIAHIDQNRAVKYYDQKLDDQIKSTIENYAKNANPKVSATQNTYVFKD